MNEGSGDQVVKSYEGAGNRQESDIDKLRVPVPPRVEIVVQDFMGFISEYASNVSKGGIFIASDTARPVGSEVDFEFRLADGFALIKGRGQVSWVREQAEGDELVAGMGVRFLTLDDSSRELVDKMVTEYVAEGGKPFDIDVGSGAGGSPRVEAPAPGPVPPAAARIPPSAAPSPGTPSPAAPPEAPSATVPAVPAAGPSPPVPPQESAVIPPAVPPPASPPEAEISAALPGEAAIQSQVSRVAGVPPAEAPSAEAPPVEQTLAPGPAEPVPIPPSAAPIPPAAAPISPPAVPTSPAQRAASADAPMEVASNETVVLSAQDLQALSMPAPPDGADATPDSEEPAGSESRVVEEIREAIGAGNAEPPPLAPGMDAAAMELDEARLQPPLPGGVADTLGAADSAPEMSSGPSPTEVVRQLGHEEPERADAAQSELEQQLGGPDASIDLGGAGISLTPEALDEPLEDDFDIQFDVTLPADEEAATSEVASSEASSEVVPPTRFEDPAPEPEPERETAPEPEAGPDDQPGSDPDPATAPEPRSLSDPEPDIDGPDIDFTEQSAALDDFQLEFSIAGTSETEAVGDEPAAEPDIDPAFLVDDPGLSGAAQEPSTPTSEVEVGDSSQDAAASQELELDEGLDEMDLGRALAVSEPAPPDGEQLTSDAELADALGQPALSGTGTRRFSVGRPSIPKPTGMGVVMTVVGLAIAAGAYLYSETFLDRWATSGLDVEAWSTELADRAELTALEAPGLRDLPEGRGTPTVTVIEENRLPQPLTELENVHWQQVDGATVVTLWGNGDFVVSGTAYQRVNGDNPREVIKLRGIERPYWESELVLATPHVRRLRLGYEAREPFAELVLVLDLSNQRARVTDIELDGRKMTLRVGR